MKRVLSFRALAASVAVVLASLSSCSRVREEAVVAELPHARPLTDRRFEATPERLERGRRLMSAMHCVLCHSDRQRDVHGAPPVPGMEFAGAVYSEAEGYRMVAPNLTPDEETGAGTWTDDMLARAIREGIGHDGRALSPVMLWSSFRALSDDDVAAVVVALRALPPVRNPLPARLLPAEDAARIAGSPRPLDGPVAERDLTDPVERGKYLIELADCIGCHTSWYTETNPGLFAGGNFIERPRLASGGAFSTNLTPSPSGIAYYDEALFVRVMREGRVGARELDGSMPWVAYGGMSDEDLEAIFAALRTVRPGDHNVDNTRQPTACAACGGEHGGGEWNKPLVLEGVEVPPAELEEWVGAYRFPDGNVVELSLEDGRLTSELTGPLFPQENGDFLSRSWGAPLRFERAEDGSAARLVSVELLPWAGERVEAR